MVFARKWMGGITLSEAVGESKKINDKGEKVILNYLGEDLADRSRVNADARMYSKIIIEMQKNRIKGSISVKPTQLGLGINYALFISNYERILAEAGKANVFVWLDMEDYGTVGDTIRAYMKEFRKHRNSGLCIQAKLKRSLDDVNHIAGQGGTIRLVKGAYKGSEEIAFMGKSDVDSSYADCMRSLFGKPCRFMIATHLERYHRKRIMFGMLKGIRPTLALSLASGGEDVHIYVPFGEQWMNYAARRLKEQGHAMLILRSMIGG
jgi:proline dehydrogenase